MQEKPPKFENDNQSDKNKKAGMSRDTQTVNEFPDPFLEEDKIEKEKDMISSEDNIPGESK